MRLYKIENPEQTTTYVLVGALIIFAVFSRLLPHPSNVAPIAAIAIFGGALLPRNLALVLPVAAMVLSDLVIGLHPLIVYTWGSFVLIALLSNRFMKIVKPRTIFSASFGASLLFYLVTNFGVWLEGRLYPQTFAGLIDCYYNALPFFRNTIMGDLLYVSVLFGAYALLQYAVRNRGLLEISDYSK